MPVISISRQPGMVQQNVLQNRLHPETGLNDDACCTFSCENVCSDNEINCCNGNLCCVVTCGTSRILEYTVVVFSSCVNEFAKCCSSSPSPSPEPSSDSTLSNFIKPSKPKPNPIHDGLALADDTQGASRLAQNDTYVSVQEGASRLAQNDTYVSVQEGASRLAQNDTYVSVQEGASRLAQNDTYVSVQEGASRLAQNDTYVSVQEGASRLVQNATYDEV